MWLMQLGEVVFGGVGSGLYGMLAFAIIAVFIAGLMVGRTPEYLGKKIEAFEMKMAAIVILIPPMVVLVGTAVAVSFPETGQAEHSQLGAARLQRSALCLLLGQQQQRQRVCRPRTPTCRSSTRCWDCACSSGRYLLEDSDAGDRRLAGRQEIHAGRAPARCPRTGRCSSCCWWAW